MRNSIDLRVIGFTHEGTHFVRKSGEGCKAQETAGLQRQSFEGSEGRRTGPRILRLPKKTILSSAPEYQSEGCHNYTTLCVLYILMALSFTMSLRPLPLFNLQAMKSFLQRLAVW